MDEFDIRVKQLKQYKLIGVVRYLLLLFISGLICFVLGFIYQFFSKNYDLSFYLFFIKFSEDLTFYCLIILLIIYLIIFSIIFWIKENDKYKINYWECMVNECRLDEIYYFENKSSNIKLSLDILKKGLNIKSPKIINSISDASNKFRLNINELKYHIGDSKLHYGLLFFVKYDQEKPGFLQVTKNSVPLIHEHDGTEVIQYGFGVKSYLRKYHMYSTLGKASYNLEDNINGKKITAISNFFNRPIELIFDNDELFIFIKDYRLKFVDSIFSKINNEKFSDKINAIKKMHKYFFELIEMFDEIFITKA